MFSMGKTPIGFCVSGSFFTKVPEILNPDGPTKKDSPLSSNLFICVFLVCYSVYFIFPVFS